MATHRSVWRFALALLVVCTPPTAVAAGAEAETEALDWFSTTISLPESYGTSYVVEWTWQLQLTGDTFAGGWLQRDSDGLEIGFLGTGARPHAHLHLADVPPGSELHIGYAPGLFGPHSMTGSVSLHVADRGPLDLTVLQFYVGASVESSILTHPQQGTAEMRTGQGVRGLDVAQAEGRPSAVADGKRLSTAVGEASFSPVVDTGSMLIAVDDCTSCAIDYTTPSSRTGTWVANRPSASHGPLRVIECDGGTGSWQARWTGIRASTGAPASVVAFLVPVSPPWCS